MRIVRALATIKQNNRTTDARLAYRKKKLLLSKVEKRRKVNFSASLHIITTKNNIIEWESSQIFTVT